MAAFAVVGLVAAQLAQTGRGVHLLALGLLVANYLLRGWQDATHGNLTWLGPQQWFAEVRGFSDSPPAWPWLAFAVWIALVGALAVVLGARRDLGAGLFRLPPGPAAGPGRGGHVGAGSGDLRGRGGRPGTPRPGGRLSHTLTRTPPWPQTRS